MSSRLPRVIVLGAGPAGVGAAFQLRRLRRADVIVIEQRDTVGGNAGSFTQWNQRLDYGSHRLHPACDPAILDDIRTLLGADLLDRPRHGRIRLRGKWVHFPLKPLDLLLHLDPGFATGAALDAVRRILPSANGADEDSFASVLRASLGRTICESFYFPYARKIWGVDPTQLSGVQARRRVSANSFAKLIRKVASQVPGLKPPGSGRFFYPRQGYGQISEAFAEAARREGAGFRFRTTVAGVQPGASAGVPWRVEVHTREGSPDVLEADFVWSTLPISLLARITTPPPPAEVLEAANALRFRAMLLIYLKLPTPQFTEFDAHYFPDANIAITRLSEPRNYVGEGTPEGQTVLCAELPCDADDERWRMSDDELGQLVAADLERAGIPLPVQPAGTMVRRLRMAYPIYDRGYERHFQTLDDWAARQPGLLSFGRQGLFAHDNTHHALAMAYAAAECLVDGRFDDERWAKHREVFATHVVED